LKKCGVAKMAAKGSALPVSEIYYRKYLSFGYAIDTLKNGIFLADPQVWEDRNDRICSARYESQTNMKLRATCFCSGTEKYHHWRSYGQPELLLSILIYKKFFDDNWSSLKPPDCKGAKFREVIYRSPTSKRPLSLESLPLYKTNAYKTEQECRFVARYVTDPEDQRLKLPSEAIAGVVINPWCHEAIVEVLASAIQKIPGYYDKPVLRSQVLEREEWKSRVDLVHRKR
jgi:hypothetical protein